MTTENRSSNTEMVSVPEGYMLVERSIWTERQVEAATACITRLKVVPSMTDRDLAMAAIDAAQCTAPDIALCDLQPALQHQGEPVALPSCKAKLSMSHDWDQGHSDGWKDCLEEISKLGPLYTHADPGETERPSQIALSLQTKLKSVESERDRLRTKLAEQEHSARELLRIIGMSVQGSAAYNRAVIAFHDSLNADTKPN